MKNNKVIYTSLVGKQDQLISPKIIYDDFDYICFSNDISTSKKIGVWNIRSIPYSNPDDTRLSRYVKLNPHLVLPEYEYSIWIDANIEIIDTTLKEQTLNLIKSSSKIANVKHPWSNCIYDDIYECIYRVKDKIPTLISQYKFLIAEGYPIKNGLYENGLIFRKHKDEEVISISNNWWKIYTQYSKRDQLSLCYVYWKHHFTPDLLLPEDKNLRNHAGFKYHKHKLSFKKKIIRELKKTRNRLLLKVYYSKKYFQNICNR